MGYRVERMGLDASRVEMAVERLMGERGKLRRLWAYYRNPMRAVGVHLGDEGSERPYRQAQEWGLPARITGVRSGSEVGALSTLSGVGRKEVVIENDIGWRVDTGVDYLFGKALTVASAAPSEKRRERITKLLRMILARSGGILFLQQLALLGSVYGFVDVLVKLEVGSAPGEQGKGAVSETADASPLPLGASEGSALTGSTEQELGEPPKEDGIGAAEEERLREMAGMIRLEIVEPMRGMAILSPVDYRVIEAYGQVWAKEKKPEGRAQRSGKRGKGWMWGKWFGIATPASRDEETIECVELITATRWQRYEDEELVSEGRNSLGVVPVVHIQNGAVPFEYAGASDVEPLIPLQDELNIRLSDRAHRIAMQSFKMYLGKGIEGFTSLPVAPGRLWMTDNEDADVVEFGGDGSCPSEVAHIADIREALDKVSAVTPIAAGAIKNKIGNLTSAAALRITLLALLSKTDKKRTSYGAGIARICELALMWLDAAGAFETSAEERRVEIHWPSPLPENEMETLAEAEAKLRIGVSKEVVLRELGY
jgi:hypothetical protein